MKNREERNLQNIVASAKFENMEPTEEEIIQLRKLANGEITYDELKAEILSDFTPEDLQFKDALKKLYETDNREPSRPLDLSFMDEEPKRIEQAEMIKRMMLADKEFLQFVLDYMAAEPNLQLEIQEMLKNSTKR